MNDVPLRAGDNALVLGQRLVALIGHAPVLEEELGIANVALDLLGHARMWLAYAGVLEGKGRSEDDLAYFRGPGEFRNAVLVEQPNGDFAHTIVRQFLFDTWHARALAAWSTSRDERIAAIAQKAKREVDYHVTRSTDWLVRLGDGTAESHARMQAALEDLWPFTGELFAFGDVERDAWLAGVRAACERATLVLPELPGSAVGAPPGIHSEHLSYLLAEMQSLRRAVPGTVW